MTADIDVWTGDTVPWNPEMIGSQIADAITADEYRNETDYGHITANLGTGTLCRVSLSAQYGTTLGPVTVAITDAHGTPLGTAHARPGGWLMVLPDGTRAAQVHAQDIAEAHRFLAIRSRREDAA